MDDVCAGIDRCEKCRRGRVINQTKTSGMSMMTGQEYSSFFNNDDGIGLLSWVVSQRGQIVWALVGICDVDEFVELFSSQKRCAFLVLLYSDYDR